MLSSEVIRPEPIPPAAPNRRQRLFLEAEGRCTYCTGQMQYRIRLGKGGGKLEPDEVTIEHLKAKSTGGSNHDDNLAAACVACNNSKADETPAEAFRAMRQRLLPEWPPCTFPPLSIRRRETGLRPVTKRFQSVFDNVDNAGYWRRWFGKDEVRKAAIVIDREKRQIAFKRRHLLEHLPGRASGREIELWRVGPLVYVKLIKGGARLTKTTI
uniref:HNH nuclease domain-containing protein n=1 Tax=Caulobacter phage BL57 TaxID=3348355 RepID=A0AB74UMR0_9VIRU